jgi:hypothetical protein
VPHVAWLPCRKTVSGSRPSAGASVGLHTTAQYEMGRSVRTSSSISASNRYSWLVTAYGPRPVGSSATGEPTATDGRSKIASVSAIRCRSACTIRCHIRRRKTRVTSSSARSKQQTHKYILTFAPKCDPIMDLLDLKCGPRCMGRGAKLDTAHAHAVVGARAPPLRATAPRSGGSEARLSQQVVLVK